MSNNHSRNGWIVCPSKRFPGKFYYFNVLNGEAAWCLTDSEKNVIGNEGNITEKSQCFPEPKSPPIIECQSGSMFFQQGKSNFTHNGNRLTKVEPVFGKVVFPKYVSNVDERTLSNIWEQNKFASFCNTRKISLVDQATQTFQSRRDICVQTTEYFLSCCSPKTEDKRENLFLKSPPPMKQYKQLFNWNEKNFPSFQDIRNCNIPSQIVKIKESIIKDVSKTTSTNFLFPKSNDDPFKPKFVKGSDTDKNVPSHFFTHKNESTQTFNLKMSVPTNIFNTSKETLKTSADSNHLLRNNTDEQANTVMSSGIVDLREILNSKKRKFSADSNKHNGGKKIKTTYEVPKKNTTKKRVTFKDLDDMKTTNNWDSDEENQHFEVTDGPVIPIMQKLTMSAKSMMRQDMWYIAVDTIVLLEEFEVIETLVQTDDRYRLLITRTVLSDIESMSSGDSCGRQRVDIARQIARKFMNPPPYVILQPPMEDNYSCNESSIDNILDCCLHIISEKFNVVLVSNDTKLLSKAKSLNIPCYRLQDIKDAISKKHVISFNSNKMTRAVDNIQDNFMNDDSQIYSNKNYLETPVNVCKKIFFEDRCGSKTMDNGLNDIDTNEQDSESNISEIGRDIIKILNIRETKKPNRILKEIALDKNQNKFNVKTPFDTEKLKSIIVNKSRLITTKGTQTTFPFQNDITSNKSMDSMKKNLPNNKSSLEDKIKNINLNFPNDIPNSNRVINRGVSGIDKILFDEVYHIEDHIKRFIVNDETTVKKIRSHLTECLCFFRQIMETTLTDVLLKMTSSLTIPLTLLEAIEKIGQNYKEHKIIVTITEELGKIITPYFGENGNFNSDVEPNDVMYMFGFGSFLLKNMKIITPQCIELGEGVELLETVFRKMEDPTPEPLLPYPVHINRSDIDMTRVNYVKDPSLVIDYLEKHYPQYKSYEEAKDDNNRPYEQKEHNSNGNEGLKVFKTRGKHLNLIEIDAKNSINIVNAKEENKKSNMERVNNNTYSVNKVTSHDVKLDPKVTIKNGEQKVIRVFKELKPFTEKLFNKTEPKNTSNTNEKQSNEKVQIRNNETVKDINKKNIKELLNELGLDDSDCSDGVINDNNKIVIDDYDSVKQNVNKVDKNDVRKSILEVESVMKCGRKPQETIKSHNREIENEGDNTNDSGIDTEGNQANSLKKSFLNELATSFQTIYKFLNDSLIEICDEEIIEERKLFFHRVFGQMLKHLDSIIDKLKRITDRESIDNTITQKADLIPSTDKRMTNYRQVVKKCTEQALYLQKALKLTLAVTDSSFERLSTVDSESINTSIQYLNIFE